MDQEDNTATKMHCQEVEPNQPMDLDDVFMSEPRDRSNDIADLLKWSYALRLCTAMRIVTKKYCNGCYYDLPSQREHNMCLIIPWQEQVDRWFDEALDKVDEDVVIGNWLGNLGNIHPSVRYHEISRYLNTEYRLVEWRDNAWKMDVKEKLLCLEHYPY